MADNRDSFYTYTQGCGMLYAAGLTNVGACSEGVDAPYYHGNIKNRETENISVLSDWADSGYCLNVSGEVRESAFVGSNLLLPTKNLHRIWEKQRTDKVQHRKSRL